MTGLKSLDETKPLNSVKSTKTLILRQILV